MRINRNINRRHHNRVPKNRILIVCEGKVTEPHYFKGLIEFYRINNVKIEGIGATPGHLVKRATRLRDNERKEGGFFDKVYCVFDRDNHSDFEQAKSNAETNNLISIKSWPCFEFWILLHFKYTRSPFDDSGDNTPSVNCVRDVKYQMSYEKNDTNIFERLHPNLEVAKEHSKSALKDATRTGNLNPSTEVHILVEFLQLLASKN